MERTCKHCDSTKDEKFFVKRNDKYRFFNICKKCWTAKNVATSQRARAKRRVDGHCVQCGTSNIIDEPSAAIFSIQINRICLRCTLKRAATRYLGKAERWEELLETFNSQDGRCNYSGEVIKIGVNAHLDHIIPSGGKDHTTIENLQWLSYRVNIMKRDLSEEEFLDLCEQITNNTKGNK